MKRIYETPCVALIECKPECLASNSGVKDMQDTGVFMETLDGE